MSKEKFDNTWFYETMGKEFTHGAKFGAQTALDLLDVFGHDMELFKSKLIEIRDEASQGYEKLKESQTL